MTTTTIEMLITRCLFDFRHLFDKVWIIYLSCHVQTGKEHYAFTHSLQFSQNVFSEAEQINILLLKKYPIKLSNIPILDVASNVTRLRIDRESWLNLHGLHDL